MSDAEHVLVLVYRNAVRLLRSGAFTSAAMRDTLDASGYRQDEVDAALDVLAEAGDLILLPFGPGQAANERVYVKGRCWPEASR